MAYRPTKAKCNFEAESDSNLLSITDKILLGMTANTSFTNVIPTVVALQTARDNYNDAFIAAGTGNRADIADKNAKRLVLETDLCTMGNFINTTYRGNDAVLATTLFPLTKEPETGVLGAVNYMKLAPGTGSGTLVCKLARVANSKNYTFLITADPLSDDSVWQSFVTTRCTYTFTGLVPGHLYWVKVIVGGTRGQTVQSGPISQYALQ